MSFYNSFEEIFEEMKKRLTLTPTAMKLWIEPLKPLKLNNNHVLLWKEVLLMAKKKGGCKGK